MKGKKVSALTNKYEEVLKKEKVKRKPRKVGNKKRRRAKKKIVEPFTKDNLVINCFRNPGSFLTF